MNFQITKLNKELKEAIHKINKPLLGIYQNGNVQIAIFEDGTKIVQTNDDEFHYDFATNIDIKITDYCANNCPFCFEGSSDKGRHGDLNHPILDTLHPYQEIALGGGNPLSHPDLESFLIRMKKKRVIVNMTVHQKDFMDSYEQLKQWTEAGWIHGLGISLINPTPELIAKVQTIPTAILHVIDGLVSKETLQTLSDNNLKILILGYKSKERGLDYQSRNNTTISKNIQYLAKNINYWTNHFTLVSFDNLACEHLNMQGNCTEQEWNITYMGDDGTQTFYIDLVREECALNSTSTDRKSINQDMNVDKAFHHVRL